MVRKYEIKNLEEVLYLGSKKEIISCEMKPLTAAGENYGSLMLALEIVIRNLSDNIEEVLKIVAKLPPPNEFIKNMFNIPVTFKKEAAFYNEIVPSLEQLLVDEGVKYELDIFPKCYGSRISANPEADYVDSDGVILLENLKIRGFTTVDCMAGCDLETSNLIIKILAQFHALPVALKLKKPDVFYKKLMPYLQKNEAFTSFSKEFSQVLIMGMVDVVKSNKKITHLAGKVKEALERNYDYYKTRKVETSAREPYATIIHNDYWTNNTMVKYVNGKPVKNVMVDFQLIEYGSPATDILFFLFSSVQKNVLDDNYDNFLDLYYRTFIETLEEMRCDVTPFTFDLLQEELSIEAKRMQFYHVMVMMTPIYSLRNKVKDICDMTEADMATSDVSPLYNSRIFDTVNSFAARNWL